MPAGLRPRRRERRVRCLKHKSEQLARLKARLDREYLTNIASADSVALMARVTKDKACTSTREVPKKPKWVFDDTT